MACSMDSIEILRRRPSSLHNMFFPKPASVQHDSNIVTVTEKAYHAMIDIQIIMTMDGNGFAFRYELTVTDVTSGVTGARY